MTLHKGGPGTARTDAGMERDQPAATGVDLTNFRMRAAPITETVIGHTSRNTSQVTGSKHGCRSNSTDLRRRTSRDASELRLFTGGASATSPVFLVDTTVKASQ